MVFYAVLAGILILSACFFLKSKQSSDIIGGQNATCVKQQTTCCSCSMGGKEECVTKEEAVEIQEKLRRECKKGIVCIARYACEDFVCEYKNNSCVKIYR